MLGDLITKSEQFDTDKADFVAQARTFQFDPSARIVPPDCMGLQVQPLTMTENALRQICSKLGPAVFGRGSAKSLPFDYIDSIPADLRAVALNNHIEHANGSKWMVRGYKDTCRAIVAGDYPGGSTDNGFENTVYLRGLDDLASKSKAASSGDFHALRPVVTPDDLIMRVSWKNIPDPKDPNQHWGLGCYLTNNEIGRGGGKVYAAVKRGSCDNTFAIDTKEYPGVDLVHRGSYAAMRAKMLDAIGTVLKVSAEVMDAIWLAEADKIPDIDDVLTGLALEHHWPTSICQSVSFGMEGQGTRMGVVNGLTWAAQHAVEDESDKVAMELFAGSMLFAPRQEFERVANKAKRVHAGIE